MEVVIGHFEDLLAQLGTPLSMIGVRAFIDSPGVVKNGEECHDVEIRPGLFPQSTPVFQNPSPMSNAMVPNNW